ncbi:hypothetical protein BI330_05340 [Mycobacterium sp. CBMA 623]|nr:hypothetical protein [Mycobacteroides sp. CBMA 326]
MGILLVVFAMMLGAVGCVPPERAVDTKKLEDGLKALPGTDAALVTNHARFSTTRRLEAKVTVRKDVTADQLAAMQNLYTKNVTEGRYQQDIAPLALAWCDSSDRPDSRFVCTLCPSDSESQPSPTNCSWVKSRAGDTPPNADWLRLWRADYAQNARLSTSGEKRAVELTVTGYSELVVPTFRRLMADFASLSGAGWKVNSGGQSLSSPDGFPDDAVLLLWGQFQKQDRVIIESTFRRNPTAAEPNSMTVGTRGYDDKLIRSSAVENLTLLREFGQPVVYTASGEKGPVLVVRVGGCSLNDRSLPRPPDSPLQTELRQEFEQC